MSRPFSPPDDPWEGLEPDEFEAPRGRNWLLLGGIVAAALCLFTFLLLAAVLLLRDTDEPEPAVIVVPTLPGAAAPPTLPLIDVAPTVTLPGQNPTPTLAAASPTVPPAPTVPGSPTYQVGAFRFETPPAINANLADWPSDWPTYRSAYRVYTHPTWDGTDDVDAVWRLGWDNNNLYIIVEVTDDIHVQTQTGNQIFRGDSVDIQFDTDRSNDAAGLNIDNFQITLSPGDFNTIPPSAFRFQGTAQGRILDAPGGHRVILAAQPTALGYIIEAAIPWSDLNLTPTTGLVIGLALNVNDNDQVGQAVQEMMKSHVPTRTLTDPTGWGTLILR
ncbi:MAG: hypothetical protein KJ063_14675 [Anaerolineae bacterium]|nr:hypothetical protein [Anaerolineae bacterium]